MNYLHKNIFLYLFFIVSQMTSIRFFLTYGLFEDNMRLIYFLIYNVLSLLIFIFFFKKDFLKIFINDKFFYLLFLFLFFLGIYFYGISERMVQINQGIDQDNCIKDLVKQFFLNLNFQYNTTYLGNPCSTGPVFVLLFSPFLLFGNSIFIIYSLICVYILKLITSKFNYKISYIVIYISLINLVLLELVFSGTDFLIIGSLFIFFIHLSLKKNLTKIDYFLFFITSLLFYSSRVLFLLLFVFIQLSFIYTKKNKKINNVHILSFICSLIIYLIFSFISNDYFHPFHLFSKLTYLASFILKNNLIYLFLVIFVISTFYLIKLNLINRILKLNLLPIYIYSILILFFIFIRINSFDFSFTTWEELNYFVLLIPSTIYLLCNFYKK